MSIKLLYKKHRYVYTNVNDIWATTEGRASVELQRSVTPVDGRRSCRIVFGTGDKLSSQPD